MKTDTSSSSLSCLQGRAGCYVHSRHLIDAAGRERAAKYPLACPPLDGLADSEAEGRAGCFPSMQLLLGECPFGLSRTQEYHPFFGIFSPSSFPPQRSLAPCTFSGAGCPQFDLLCSRPWTKPQHLGDSGLLPPQFLPYPLAAPQPQEGVAATFSCLLEVRRSALPSFPWAVLVEAHTVSSKRPGYQRKQTQPCCWVATAQEFENWWLWGACSLRTDLPAPSYFQAILCRLSECLGLPQKPHRRKAERRGRHLEVSVFGS